MNAPARPQSEVSRFTVDAARKLMRQGCSLRTAAATVGVTPSDLDRAIWKHLGEDRR